MKDYGVLDLYDFALKNAIRRLYLKFNGRDPSNESRLVRELVGSDGFEENCRKLLAHVLLYALDNVPYYRGALGFLRDIVITNNGCVDLSAFDKVPMLVRKEIRRNFARLLSKDYANRRPYLMSSSGSTGDPLRVVLDSTYDRWVSATVEFYYSEMVGIDFNRVRKLFLISNVPTRTRAKGVLSFLFHRVNNMMRLHCGELSRGVFEGHLKTLNSYKPVLLHGNASTLYELSRFIERTDAKHHKPDVIVSTGEVLHDFMRSKIEGVFSRRVHDFYGAREVSGIAGQCSEGLMHVFAFNNYVEILDCGNDEGDVVLTPLHNFSMPLIRYRIGDQARGKLAKCRCGSPLPALRKIVGRTVDHFITEDRRLIHGSNFIRLLRNEQLVEAFRVVQEDVNRIRILVVMKKMNTDWVRYVEEEMRLLMGKKCRIVWEFLDDIPASAGGKHLYVRSLLHE